MGCVLNKVHLSRFIFQCNFSTFKHKSSFLTVKHNFVLHIIPYLRNVFKTHIFFLHAKTVLFIAVKGYWNSLPPTKQNSVKVFTEKTELSLIIKFILMVWWTNPRCQLPGWLKFCTVVPNTCMYRVWNLLHITPRVTEIYRKLLHFWKIRWSLY